MFSLSVLVLTLLVSAVQASFSSGGSGNYNYDLSGQALTDLYNSQIYKAEWVKRPLSFTSSAFGPISHSGVKVTLADGTQWLIHKGSNFGINSQTVVVNADHMSSKWKTMSTRDFHGSRTVADLVKAGGSRYNLFTNNCHTGSRRMMRGVPLKRIPAELEHLKKVPGQSMD